MNYILFWHECLEDYNISHGFHFRNLWLPLHQHPKYRGTLPGENEMYLCPDNNFRNQCWSTKILANTLISKE